MDFRKFLEISQNQEPKFDKPFNWSREKKDMYHLNQTVPPHDETASIPLKLGYDSYNVFQRYWNGQSDPLYALFSRRGNSVDIVTVFATPEEVDRLKEVANEILKTSKDTGELRTAQHYLEML